MQNNRMLSFLGLIRKAGKIAVGESNTGKAVHQKSAKLIILAHDASPNAVKRAKSFAEAAGCSILSVPVCKDTLASALGVSPFAMAAICDSGLAEAFIGIIKQTDRNPESRIEEIGECLWEC